MKRRIKISISEHYSNPDFDRFDIYLDNISVGSTRNNQYKINGAGEIAVKAKYHSATTKDADFITEEQIDYTRSNRHGLLNFQIRDVESGIAGHVLAFIKFAPIRVECIHYKGYYEMIGISPIFPEIDEGCVSPNYDLLIKTDENNEIISVTIKDE